MGISKSRMGCGASGHTKEQQWIAAVHANNVTEIAKMCWENQNEGDLIHGWKTLEDVCFVKEKSTYTPKTWARQLRLLVGKRNPSKLPRSKTEDYTTDWTALHFAADFGNLALVELLIRAEVDPNGDVSKSSSGTALR